MTSGFDAAFNFTDLQGLAALRRDAAADSPEARQAVAQQFEALFLNLMLKEMRAASSVIDGGLFDRESIAFHESMLDQQLALTLARGNGTGLAPSILRALGGDSPVPVGPAENLAALSFRAIPASGHTSANQSETQESVVPGIGRNLVATPHDADFSPESPTAFVETLWPHAERAARAVGTTPEVLVAQAALETGWGRHTIRDDAGRPSFNIFGVKARSGWSGPRAVTSTIEFVGGLPERKREPFRMYSSLADGFDDYVALIRTPRYASALNAETAEEYVRGLQRAGYATDPDYAEKIMGILERGLPGRTDQVPLPRTDITMSRVSESVGQGQS